MRKLASSLLALSLALGIMVGCTALSQPTDTAPGWVQLVDKLTATYKDATGKVQSTGTPPDPTSGTVPAVTLGIGVLALAWRVIRALENSTPASIPTNTPVAAAPTTTTTTPGNSTPATTKPAGT